MLAVLVVATLWSTPFQFALFVSAILLVGVQEWTGLMGLQGHVQRGGYLLAFVLAMVLLSAAMGLSPDAQALSRPVVLAVTGAGVLFWLYAFTLVRSFPATQSLWATRPRTARDRTAHASANLVRSDTTEISQCSGVHGVRRHCAGQHR